MFMLFFFLYWKRGKAPTPPLAVLLRKSPVLLRARLFSLVRTQIGLTKDNFAANSRGRCLVVKWLGVLGKDESALSKTGHSLSKAQRCGGGGLSIIGADFGALFAEKCFLGSPSQKSAPKKVSGAGLIFLCLDIHPHIRGIQLRPEGRNRRGKTRLRGPEVLGPLRALGIRPLVSVIRGLGNPFPEAP